MGAVHDNTTLQKQAFSVKFGEKLLLLCLMICAAYDVNIFHI